MPRDILNELGFDYEDNGENYPIKTAAICVYPSKVESAVKTLKEIGLYGKINVASGS